MDMLVGQGLCEVYSLSADTFLLTFYCTSREYQRIIMVRTPWEPSTRHSIFTEIILWSSRDTFLRRP